ncbi:MAG: DNA polymerase III subunit alpha, partial [Treponema sp.]|nr:DNA polymerase III subunit alpha [Treponema sp.]
ISRKLNIPTAFLDTSVLLESGDFAVHRALRAIGLNKTVGNLAAADTLAEGSGIFRTSGELRGRLESWPDAARGTARIASLCQYNDVYSGLIFPSCGENPGAQLRRLVYEGAALRYGELGDMETDRIEYELDIIGQTGFSAYFLRMDSIVKMAAGVRGAAAAGRTSVMYRTCGRGSGAASIVSYSLGITNVDPIAHNLYFERFLNPARSDPPDIDVDFAWDERDALIKTVIEKIGPEYCARVANHNFFRSRSALRETAKAYGFSDVEITRLERRIFDFREKEDDIDPLWREIYGIAERIEGLPRGLGMHCGGLVITPQPVARYVPVEKSAEGFPLIAWEKEGTEAAGFVKIDLLGNRSLAVIRDALANLEEQGIIIDPYTWKPIKDEETIQALARGDSMGVFYIESPAMRQLQKKTGAGDFEHIVIHSSIIRPAANKFISEYVRRLKGGKWTPLHPRLERILGETYGILCYQEDVSKTAMALAGFNDADADKLRKVIAKKAGAAKLAVYEDQFFTGCRKNGVCEDTIRQIWEMMLSFDGYSFCKPHSASYAMVSFQSAYLRVHHPSQFMAAVLSNQGGYYRPGAYISECRRMGICTAGPDVNISRQKYYGIDNEKLKIKNEELKKGTEKEKIRNEENRAFSRGTVVIGFMAIKGLSVLGMKAIIEERERGGEYKNLDDFSRRVSLNRDDIIALCPAGIFDSIAGGLSRPLQTRFLLGVGGVGNGKWLFGSGDCVSEHIALQHAQMANNDAHSLSAEFESLGFLRNLHPLALWGNRLAGVRRVMAVDLHGYLERRVCLAGWPITQKDVWTKDGLTMSFLSLEDETAMYETVIFPQVYDRYQKFLFDQKPLLVYGRVVSDQGALILEVDTVRYLL